MIEIYGTPNCSACKNAVAFVEKMGFKAYVDYIYKDIMLDDTYLAEMMERAKGAKTMPQIFIGDTHIGGFAELREEIQK